MRLCPGVDILAVSWIRIHPGLGDGVVQVRPLSHDVRITLELVLLKPSLDVGSNQLPGFGSALIFHNRSESAGDAVAQQVVRGSVGGCRRSRRIVGSSRGPWLEVFVLGEWLGNQPGTDNFSIRTFDQATIGLKRKENLTDHPDRKWIYDAADDYAERQEYNAL